MKTFWNQVVEMLCSSVNALKINGLLKDEFYKLW